MKKVEVETRVHEKTIDFLSRQREEMERSIQEWMGRYEEDTENKANELESLKQSRTTDLDKFEELMASYEELEKVVEEDRQIKLQEAENLKMEKLRNKHAGRIQRWWRAILKKRAEAQVISCSKSYPNQAAKQASKKSAKGKKKK